MKGYRYGWRWETSEKFPTFIAVWVERDDHRRIIRRYEPARPYIREMDDLEGKISRLVDVLNHGRGQARERAIRHLWGV